MVELTDLRLPHVNGELSADRLRQFLVLICSCRSNLTLPPKDEPLTWDFVGVMPPAGATLAVGSLHTLLKRMNYVLALPPDRFKKAGAFSLPTLPFLGQHVGIHNRHWVEQSEERTSVQTCACSCRPRRSSICHRNEWKLADSCRWLPDCGNE